MTTKSSNRRATRSDGVQSREAILNAAARLATIEGLDGMSIGRLAEFTGMSKSGIYAHFGSKEELQLATVETAAAIFDQEVMQCAAGIEDPVEHLVALGDAFLDHLERGVFPGGCFFASAVYEFDTRPGPVLDRVQVTLDQWTSTLISQVRAGQAQGAINPEEDPDQLAWELDAFLLMGNLGWVLERNATPLRRARAGFRRRLEAARAGAGA